MKNLTRFLFVLCFVSHVNAQIPKLFKKKKAPEKVEAPKPKKKDKNAIKPYDEVITEKAVSDIGLFDVHKVDEDYFFEIPDSLFGKEMLMVTRIAKTASGIGFGGGKQNTQVLRWEKDTKKVLLRVVSHQVVAADSLPIHLSLIHI